MAIGGDVDPSLSDHPGVLLVMLRTFAVYLGSEPVEVAPAAQRVLASLALLGGAAQRIRLAGMLWPDCTDQRALANLRGVLWRMPEPVRGNLDTRGLALRLGRNWTVDVHVAVAEARKVGDRLPGGVVDRTLFAEELLPDWDDEWLVVARERHRQLRLHALEELAAAEIADGRPLDAVDTAMLALAAEPLRESAQRLLLRAHLAAGNRAAVRREFGRFQRMLRTELGVEPSPAVHAIVTEAMSPR